MDNIRLMPSVLFVCVGNICRSPTAEMVMKARYPGFGLVESAGVYASRGASIDARSRGLLEKGGIAVDRKFRSSRVTAEDFERFDLIIAMERDNLDALIEMRPTESRAEIRLLTDFVPGMQDQDVPDPYYGPAQGFAYVLTLIERGVEGLAKHKTPEPG